MLKKKTLESIRGLFKENISDGFIFGGNYVVYLNYVGICLGYLLEKEDVFQGLEGWFLGVFLVVSKSYCRLLLEVGDCVVGVGERIAC